MAVESPKPKGRVAYHAGTPRMTSVKVKIVGPLLLPREEVRIVWSACGVTDGDLHVIARIASTFGAWCARRRASYLIKIRGDHVSKGVINTGLLYSCW